MEKSHVIFFLANYHHQLSGVGMDEECGGISSRLPSPVRRQRRVPKENVRL